MKQSELFTKTQREAPKDEEAFNAQLLSRAGFIDKVMAGVYSYLPLGNMVLKNIESIVRNEMFEIGGQEILMPALQPKSLWEQTGRWGKYDSLFRFKSHFSKNEYVLGPTHEEIVVPLAKKYVSSYKDLPFCAFQIQTKFRDEARAKSGLLRGKEFLMKDLYSFHRDEKDLDEYYDKVTVSYKKIFKKVGLDKDTYLTFASGGTFSKYSHEFQTITPYGEDKIHLCEKCGLAVNNEIINEQDSCPQCGNRKLKEEKGSEVGNIFKLKNRYSQPFNLKYKDEKGEEKEVLMGCYGIGISRLMGVIAETYNDEKGIIWPESVAPFQIHLLHIGNSPASLKFADKVYQVLQKSCIKVLYDDRKSATAGEKFSDSDLIGIPWRAVVSEKTGDKIEIKKRSEEKTELVSEKNLIDLIK